MLALVAGAVLAAIGADPAGYTCQPGIDVAGQSCDISPRAPPGSVAALAALCTETAGCRGFNTNGYLKRCVRQHCGARQKRAAPGVTSCILAATPVDQPVPAGCAGPSPPGPPPPNPPPPPPLPGRNCSVTAARPDCNCSGVHPPFDAPVGGIPTQVDYHFPAEEPAEAAALVVPILVSSSSTTATGGGEVGRPPRPTATLRDPATNETATLAVGETRWGWELSWASATTAVVEHDFERWAMLAFLTRGCDPQLVRKPVGMPWAIRQPVYNFADPEYDCKQDIDPADWLGRIARNISGGGGGDDSAETDLLAGIRVMAPNPDTGLFGNPEELNKFLLTDSFTVESTPWGGRKGHLGGGGGGGGNGSVLFALSDYLPPFCVAPKHDDGSFWNVITGMASGQPRSSGLRVVSQGLWHSDAGGAATGGGCGAELLVVAPFATADVPTSTAMIRATTWTSRTNGTTSYFRAVAAQNDSAMIALDHLGGDGELFYANLLANVERWDTFAAAGAEIGVPASDRRIHATANSLVSMYMNLDRGLAPEYGGGKFWNTYNEYLPLDTLALNVRISTSSWSFQPTLPQPSCSGFAHRLTRSRDVDAQISQNNQGSVCPK